MNTLRTLALALAVTVAAAPALAQQQRVYQWKDAKGVTHYTDVPPAQAHQTRDLDVKDGKPAEAAAKKPESEQCTNARANLVRLEGGGPIGIDTNGDGKPDRNMSDDERKPQIELNQAAVKAFCTPAAR
ncbi:DUF4124 domain-containing protein [Thermomonas brevis]|uniref:DUF4124 domain-containing protein n=1 Tax=Thermomonas brevis TaxID=215691 RepID=A0A7G9QWU4_9GAMM|nr:DUF4124 domain-containing protein [Thermomonas brevis]QNN47819.1 DUF4124 domain-containing protein [Thermomonas brevis]